MIISVAIGDMVKILYSIKISNMDIIPGLHASILSLNLALQRGLQVISGGKNQILKKRSTNICFGDKMANISGEGFIIRNKFIE